MAAVVACLRMQRVRWCASDAFRLLCGLLCPACSFFTRTARVVAGCVHAALDNVWHVGLGNTDTLAGVLLSLGACAC